VTILPVSNGNTPQYDMKMLIVTVTEDDTVVMTEEAVNTVLGKSREGASKETYSVTYPVVKELLNSNRYRLWGEID
jgi:sulfur transfer complex TusBCD TusB component (DsrH family)